MRLASRTIAPIIPETVLPRPPIDGAGVSGAEPEPEEPEEPDEPEDPVEPEGVLVSATGAAEAACRVPVGRVVPPDVEDPLWRCAVPEPPEPALGAERTDD